MVSVGFQTWGWCSLRPSLLELLPTQYRGQPRASTHRPFKTSLHQPSSSSQQESKVCPDPRGPGAVSSLLVQD